MIPSQKTESMRCIRVFGGENGYIDGKIYSVYILESLTLERFFFICKDRQFLWRAVLQICFCSFRKEDTFIMANVIVGLILIIGVGIAVKEMLSKNKK